MSEENKTVGIDLDFEYVHRLLLDAARKAFTETRQQHSDEQFYAFALMISPWVFFVLPTSNTEEGLLRAAEKAASDSGKRTTTMTIHQMYKEMRWLCSDWDYHREHEGYFSELNELLADMPTSLEGVSDEEHRAIFDRYRYICTG